MVRAGFAVEGSWLKRQRIRVYPSVPPPPVVRGVFRVNGQGLGGVTMGGGGYHWGGGGVDCVPRAHIDPVPVDIKTHFRRQAAAAKPGLHQRLT